MKTRITELLGCEYPIIQGGMAWVAEHTLASAVSNAGGIGLIAGGSAPIDYLREQIRLCKEKTNKPFGVNIMLMSPNADDLAQLCIDEGVKVITTGAGNPGKYMAAFSTTIPTRYRVPCLMTDHLYRMAIVWQNVGYNQPPHLGRFLPEIVSAPQK